VNELDAIILSGYHLRSYITFIKEFIPCETMKVNYETPGIRQVFSVRDNKAGSQAVDLFIFLSTENSTNIIIPTKPGQFDNSSEDKLPFERSQPTLAVLSVGVSSPQNILQITN
jgi:hypothetical protein